MSTTTDGPRALSAMRHAMLASELLAAVMETEKALDELPPHERLQMHAPGGVQKYNATQQFRVELATAHAQTALALTAVQQAGYR